MYLDLFWPNLKRTSTASLSAALHRHSEEVPSPGRNPEGERIICKHLESQEDTRTSALLFNPLQSLRNPAPPRAWPPEPGRSFETSAAPRSQGAELGGLLRASVSGCMIVSPAFSSSALGTSASAGARRNTTSWAEYSGFDNVQQQDSKQNIGTAPVEPAGAKSPSCSHSATVVHCQASPHPQGSRQGARQPAARIAALRISPLEAPVVPLDQGRISCSSW